MGGGVCARHALLGARFSGHGYSGASQLRKKATVLFSLPEESFA